MWCKNCRQDVPAVAAADRGGVRCSRCGGSLRQPEPVAVTVHTAGLEAGDESDFESKRPAPVSQEPDSDFDDWALDIELQRMQRLVSASLNPGESPPPALPPLPLTHSTASGSGNTIDLASHAVAGNSIGPARRSSITVWVLLGSGIMAFVCGAVLLAWSLVADRGELWTLGMPICLAGQLGLLLALVFQLTRLWDDNRRTAIQLASVNERLTDLKQTASLLATGNGTPGQSFYAHMAGGASPQTLVADLKGQLDLLAVQMAAARR